MQYWYKCKKLMNSTVPILIGTLYIHYTQLLKLFQICQSIYYDNVKIHVFICILQDSFILFVQFQDLYLVISRLPICNVRALCIVVLQMGTGFVFFRPIRR